MSKLRDFFTGLPEACGVEPDVAKLYGEHLGKLFDHEVTKPNSVFSRKSGQGVDSRLAPAFSGWEMFADLDKLTYAQDLAVYLAKCHSVNVKGEKFDGLEEDRLSLETDEVDYPEISALMTVSEASTMGNWV